MRIWIMMVLLHFFANISAQKTPNIILIFSDDQGWNDVGCYGSEIPTPHIDRFASEGIKFEHFYSVSSICTPSRFGLLTGTHPSRSQDLLLGALMFMGDQDRGIRPEETTLAEVLRQNGYTTALIGKWHLGHSSRAFLPTNHGFEYFRGHTGGCIDYFTMTYGAIPDWYHGTQHVQVDGYATELITEEAIRYLEQRDSVQPFFLYLPYNAPHYGKGYSPAKDEPINIMQAQAADLDRVSHINDKVRREFAAMTVNLDDGIGRILNYLDSTGMSDNTLVIFLSDNGGDPVYGGSNLPLRGKKATLFEGGIRVPALMRWKGKLPEGEVNTSIFWSMDLFPTICTWADVDYDLALLDGIDMSTVLFDNKFTEPRELFWELASSGDNDTKPWGALLRGRWKYVYSPVDGPHLFDLQEDPLESTNLVEDQTKLLQDMQARWDQLATAFREE